MLVSGRPGKSELIEGAPNEGTPKSVTGARGDPEVEEGLGTVVPGAAVAVGAAVALGAGVGVGVTTMLVMLALQITSAPPPLVEPLH